MNTDYLKKCAAKLLTEKMGGRIWAAYENETLQVFVDFPQ